MRSVEIFFLYQRLTWTPGPRRREWKGRGGWAEELRGVVAGRGVAGVLNDLKIKIGNIVFFCFFDDKINC